MKKPIISIIIPTYNRKEQIVRLVQSIKESSYPRESIEVIVVDNASDPNLVKELKNLLSGLIVLSPGKNLYSNGARKLGAAAAKGDYIFFLDDDNTLEKDCLTALADAMEQNPDLGAVGPVMLNGNSDVIWSIGARVTRFGKCIHLYSEQLLHDTALPEIIPNVEYFPNACMVRKGVLQKVPLDDEAFPHNWAEIDFGLRILAAGYQTAGISAAVERHHIGYTGKLTRLRSTTVYDQAKSRILFRKRHMPTLSDWAKFWGIIFPVSSALYIKRIVQSPDDKWHMLGSYIRGTYDGIVSSATNIPKVMHEEGA